MSIGDEETYASDRWESPAEPTTVSDLIKLKGLSEKLDTLRAGQLAREKEKVENACQLLDMLVDYVATDLVYFSSPGRRKMLRKVRATVRELRR